MEAGRAPAKILASNSKIRSLFVLHSFRPPVSMPLWPLSTTREALDEEAASLTRNASPWTREPELPTRGDDDGANGIRRFNDDKDSTGGLAAATSTRWKRDAADTRRSVMVRYAIASFLLVAVFGAYARHAGYFSSYRAVTAFDSDDEGISDRGTPWAKFGLETSVALSVKPARLPPCERTMLVDWVGRRPPPCFSCTSLYQERGERNLISSPLHPTLQQSFQFGFGSTATTIVGLCCSRFSQAKSRILIRSYFGSYPFSSKP